MSGEVIVREFPFLGLRRKINIFKKDEGSTPIFAALVS